MSEQAWKEFLGSEGLDDWVVLHGGATAVFRVGSVREAASLAEAVASVSGLEGSEAVLTISDARLSVRISRDLWGLEARHVELARAISAVAQEHGAVADRASVHEVQLAIAAKPDAIDVGFWRAVLGYAPMADDAMHLDVSVAREHAEARLAAALAAGGRVVDESDDPGHWTLADRAGNRVCITAWPDGSTQR